MKENQEIKPITATSKDGLTVWHTNQKTKFGNFMLVRQSFLGPKKKYFGLTKFYGYKSQRQTNQALKTKILNLNYKITINK